MTVERDRLSPRMLRLIRWYATGRQYPKLTGPHGLSRRDGTRP